MMINERQIRTLTSPHNLWFYLKKYLAICTQLDPLVMISLSSETVLAELQTAKARGEVGSLDEFERQVTNAAIEIRKRLQQMADRVAPMVVGLKIAEIKRILRDEVDQALTVLADKLGSA